MILCQPKIKVQIYESKIKILVTCNQTSKMSISCKLRTNPRTLQQKNKPKPKYSRNQIKLKQKS